MIPGMLELRDAWFRYDAGRDWILRGASLTIEKRDLVHVGGGSGGGKTTFLKILSRLLELDKGRLLWKGKSAGSVPASVYRSRVIYVPQEPFMRRGTVTENLLFPFSFAANCERQQPGPERILAILESFGLGSVKKDDSAGDLSVGQAMRLSVVRSLLLEPEVLLLDEPLAGLDRESRRLFEAGIAAALRQNGLAVVLVSHIPVENELKESAIRRLDLAAGRFEEHQA